jgi:prolipoprotein diacylglyceryltransferase
METITLLICVFVFLFTLYGLSRDDFVLLRKNVSMDEVFNISFLALLSALFVGRLLYVVSHYTPTFLNPLVFLAIPYYPGVSIIGAVMGFVGFCLLYTAYKKIAKERLFDFFTIALLVSLTVGYLIHLVVLTVYKFTIEISMLLLPFLLVLLCSIIFTVLLPRQRRGEMKDAHLGLTFLVVFSAGTFLTDVLSKNNKLVSVLSIEGFAAILIFLLALFLLLKKERKVIKFAKIRI